MEINTRKTGEATVLVYLRQPGDYGTIKIGRETRSAAEWARMAEDVARAIRRHVDDVDAVLVQQDTAYLVGDDEHGRLFDAIDCHIEDLSVRCWRILHGKPGEPKTQTRRFYDFREVVELVWREARTEDWTFHDIGSTPMTPKERDYLDRVMALRRRAD